MLILNESGFLPISGSPYEKLAQQYRFATKEISRVQFFPVILDAGAPELGNTNDNIGDDVGRPGVNPKKRAVLAREDMSAELFDAITAGASEEEESFVVAVPANWLDEDITKSHIIIAAAMDVAAWAVDASPIPGNFVSDDIVADVFRAMIAARLVKYLFRRRPVCEVNFAMATILHHLTLAISEKGGAVFNIPLDEIFSMVFKFASQGDGSGIDAEIDAEDVASEAEGVLVALCRNAAPA